MKRLFIALLLMVMALGASTVKAQTPESIAAFARQILADGNKVEVVMTPEE